MPGPAPPGSRTAPPGSGPAPPGSGAEPLVSVIVPNYNHSRSLPLTLPALQAQTYPRLEILFVDDCSTDGSLAVARERGVRALSTPRNSGAAAVRNLGAARASGEILVFVDSDVAVPPGTVAAAVGLLTADSSVGAYCGMLAETPLVRDSLVQECRCLQAHYWRTSSEGAITVLGTALCAMRREVFRATGGFHEGLRETEELEYGDRLARHYRIEFTSTLSGRHRDDHRLWPLLRKVFRRCRLRVPFYIRRRRPVKGFETGPRILAAGCALLAVATVPAPWLLGPAGAAVPALLLAAFLAADAGMYRFVLRRRGPAFGAVFAGVQLLLNLAIAVGVAAGALQWLVSSSFRAMYDRPPAPVPDTELTVGRRNRDN